MRLVFHRAFSCAAITLSRFPEKGKSLSDIFTNIARTSSYLPELCLPAAIPRSDGAPARLRIVSALW